ncbi:MAG TPA: Holliday junction branch migration protein RuvA [Patescibacteria group bacterium]|nr:Holliday junction branch migration protein RuvA [Patescibacteria group bacterium]
MIALLEGTPVISGNTCIMMCHGVGYGVAVSERTKQALSSMETARLYVHTHVREDAFELYGFRTPDEQKLFEMLLTVSGVGPKTALSVTGADVSQIRSAVESGSVSFFSTFPRVGKKLAQKIIIELKSKFGSLDDLDLSSTEGKGGEVRQALETLGYPDQDIRKALRKIPVDTLSLQEAIKQAMKLLSSS